MTRRPPSSSGVSRLTAAWGAQPTRAHDTTGALARGRLRIDAHRPSTAPPRQPVMRTLETIAETPRGKQFALKADRLSLPSGKLDDARVQLVKCVPERTIQRGSGGTPPDSLRGARSRTDVTPLADPHRTGIHSAGHGRERRAFESISALPRPGSEDHIVDAMLGREPRRATSLHILRRYISAKQWVGEGAARVRASGDDGV